MTDWKLPVGTDLLRDEFDSLAGFSIEKQAGICHPNGYPFVVIFSDKDAAYENGYIYDGWVNDNQFFQYTGQGVSGDQTFTSKNKAIRDAQANNESIHIFCAKENISPGGMKHVYIGEFSLERTLSAESFGRDDLLRQVIVFQFKPVDGDILIRHEDQCSTDVSLPSRSITKTKNRNNRTRREGLKKATDIKRTSGKRKRKSIDEMEINTPEFDLQDQFENFLEKKNIEWVYYQIPVDGITGRLEIDLYIPSMDLLCELKGSAVRENIRMSIGQLKDYEHHLKKFGVTPKSLAVVLPSKPADDLLELLQMIGIECIYAGDSKSFVSNIDFDS